MASDLSPVEAAWLVSILRNPRGGYSKQFLRRRARMFRVRWIVERMKNLEEVERDDALHKVVKFNAGDGVAP